MERPGPKGREAARPETRSVSLRPRQEIVLSVLKHDGHCGANGAVEMVSGRMGGLTARRKHATSSPIAVASHAARHDRAGRGRGRKTAVSTDRLRDAADAGVISGLLAREAAKAASTCQIAPTPLVFGEVAPRPVSPKASKAAA